MKICLDMRYKTESGGSTYVKEVAERLLRLDRSNHYTLLKYPEQNFPFESRAAEIMVAPNLPNAIDLLWTATVLPFKLRERQIDVYHGLKSPVPIRNLVPTITTMHSTHDSYKSEYHNNWRMKLFFKLYGNRVWSHCTAVITVSKFVHEAITQHHHVPTDKVFVIHHGIDEAFHPRSREEIAPVLAKHGLTPGYVLSLGNVTPIKNQITILRALARLAPSLRPQLVFQGKLDHPNSNYAELKAAAEQLRIADRVRFMGYLPRQEVVDIVNGAGVMAFPSHNEGFGFAMMETLRCGVPVIVSNIGPLPYLGGEGVMVMKDRRDADELAGLLTRVLGDPAVRARLSRGAVEAAALCTWDRAARQHLEVYEWTHRKARAARAGVTWGTADTVGERVS
jgi:alpha-1,3-rhamnosyl/mannosyltransferase